MPGKAPRDKGNAEERAIVNLHRELKFPAERTLERGSRSDGSKTWDVDLYINGKDGFPIIGECKIRAKGFKNIYNWLGENDFLTIRADRKERLYVVPERVWIDLITK